VKHGAVVNSIECSRMIMIVKELLSMVNK